MNWAQVTFVGVRSLLCELVLAALVLLAVVWVNDRKIGAWVTAVALVVAAVIGLIAGCPLTVTWGG